MRAPVHSARIAARLTASIATTAGREARCASGSVRPAARMRRLAPLHDRVGLGVQRDALAGRRHHLESFEHRAGRGRGDLAERVAHVELEADHAGLDQRRHVLDRVLAEHARRGRNRRAPFRPPSRAWRRAPPAVPTVGIVFGMSNTVVTPPKAAAMVPLREVFLLRIAGIAEVHMHVDRAGQHVHAGDIDGLASRAASRRRADAEDFSVLDGDAASITASGETTLPP